MSISKQDLASHLLSAAGSGTLVTPKHDPASGSVVWNSYRTILDAQVSSSLSAMLASGSFSAQEYIDPLFTAPTYLIQPAASFASLGSAIPSGSTGQTASFDRIVAVEGSKAGWHIYAENQSTFDSKTASGSITLAGSVL